MKRSRRILGALAATLLAGMLLSGPNPRDFRNAMTNEGYEVVMVRPVNGLPPGWVWLP